MKFFFANLLFIFLFTALGTTKAQVNPPDIQCLVADTLFWETPVNPCGPFQAYEIYSATSMDGPFSLLVTITDPAQISYFDENPLDETRFYYMRSVYDCPGEPVLNSDTINNQLPLAEPIDFASVENNQVRLSWQVSTSPETFAYIIYRETFQGTVPIDTVFVGTSFTDSLIDPSSEPFTYYVLALDPCGNASIFGTPHRTMVLESSVNSCTQSAALTWNAYEGWPVGVESYVIWLQESGGPFEPVDTIPGNTTTYTYSGLDDQLDYCFRVSAEQSGGSNESFSSETCFFTDIVQPIRQLEPVAVTFDDQNRVSVSWQWNEEAELNSGQLWRFFENDDQVVSIQTLPIALPLPTDPTITDDEVIQDERPFYFLETIDNCDSVVTSVQVAPVFLQVNALPGRENELSWEAAQLPGFTPEAYEVYVAGSGNLLAVTDAATQMYRDEIDASVSGARERCYVVIAQGRYSFQDGTDQLLRLQSNTVCAEQLVEIRIPNAFAPLGVNAIFKPKFIFGNAVQNYAFRIFDRWGKIVFETNDPLEGWDGNVDGEVAPQGMYVYQIVYNQPNGQEEEYKGQVFLLR